MWTDISVPTGAVTSTDLALNPATYDSSTKTYVDENGNAIKSLLIKAYDGRLVVTPATSTKEMPQDLGTDKTITADAGTQNGGALEVQAGAYATGTNLTYVSNSVTGADAKGGAIYNAGYLSLDTATFSGNTATDSTSGAVYNAGTLLMTGDITLATSSDTIYNVGTLNWDLTGETTAKLVNYQYLTNAAGEGGKLTLTVKADESDGAEYTIATGNLTDLAGKDTFTLVGVDGCADASVSVGSGTVYNKLLYILNKNDNDTSDDATDDKLVLTTKTYDAATILVNTAWEGTSFGEEIEIDDTTYIYGASACSSAEAASQGVQKDTTNVTIYGSETSAGDLTLGQSLTLGTTETEDNDARLDALTVSSNNTVTLDCYAVLTTKDVSITNADGELTMDFTSQISFSGSWVNSGSLTVDMVGASALAYKLVDNTGTEASDYGTYEFVSGKDAGYSLTVVDKDLYAVDPTKILVNSNYASLYKAGDAIEDRQGYIYGVNAFSEISSDVSKVTTLGVTGGVAALDAEISLAADATVKVDEGATLTMLGGKIISNYTVDGTGKIILAAGENVEKYKSDHDITEESEVTVTAVNFSGTSDVTTSELTDEEYPNGVITGNLAPEAATTAMTIDKNDNKNLEVAGNVTGTASQTLILANSNKNQSEDKGELVVDGKVSGFDTVLIENATEQKMYINQTLEATNDVTISNQGHLEAKVRAGGDVTIVNTSANTLIGDYAGQNVNVTNKAGAAAENVTLQAYGDTVSVPATAGTVTLEGEADSTFTGSNKIVAGLNATPADVTANDGTGTVNLNGTNTFSGELEVKAATITTSDASATVNLNGVAAKFGANLSDKLAVNISGTTSISKIDGTQVTLNGYGDTITSLADGTVLTTGTNVNATLKTIQDATVTLEGGAKLKSQNALTLSAGTLTLTGTGTEWSVNTGAGATIDSTSTLTIEDGAMLVAAQEVSNEGTLNVENATLTTSNYAIQNYGTMNLTGATLNSSYVNNTATEVTNVYAGKTTIISSDSYSALDNSGTLNLEKDAVLEFSGVTKIITNSNGTVNLKGGTIDDGAAFRTGFSGTVNWVLDNSEYTASSLAWSVVSDASQTKTITVDADAKWDAETSTGDTYTLATSAGMATDLTLTLVGYVYDQAITVGGDAVDYNGLQYTLALNSTDDLVLSVTGVSTVEAIAEYAGGQAGQHTNVDAYTYYTKLDTVAAAAFDDPGADKGAVSYRWVVSDEWVGYENAKTQYNWKTTDEGGQATALDGKGVAIGQTDAYNFIYLAGYDKDGKQVSMNIYQALRDTAVPTVTEEVKGDLTEADQTAGIEAGWVNKNTANAGVTYDAEHKTYSSGTLNEKAKDAGYKVNVIAGDTGSGVQVTTEDGTVQKYWVSSNWIGGEVDLTDDNVWTEYDQSNPFAFAQEGTYKGYTIAVADKAGNVTTQAMSEIKIDYTDAETGAGQDGTDGANGWYKKGDTAYSFTVNATDETSGIAEKGAIVLYKQVTDDQGATSWVKVEDVDPTVTGTKNDRDYSWALTDYQGDLKYVVTDQAGNDVEAVVTDIKVDQTDAVIGTVERTKAISTVPVLGPGPIFAQEFKPDGENGWYKTPLTFTVTATDNLSGVDYVEYQALDESGAVQVTGKAKYDIAKNNWSVLADETGSGAYTYQFRVVDKAGNVSDWGNDQTVKVDTIKPDMTKATFTVTATNATNLDETGKVQTVTDMTTGTWITNRADGGKGTFTLGGTLKLDEDTGSKVTPSINVTYEYQEWDSITNSWVSVKTTETYDYPNTGVWTYDAETGDWQLTTTLDTVANAAGTFTIEVSAKDEAGNESAKSATFTGSFDNTMPSNPTVTLCDVKGMGFGTSGSKAYIDRADQANIYSQTGDDIAVKAVDGATANDPSEGISQADIAYRYWAATTGAFDIVELGKKLATSAVREAAVDTIVSVDNADKYWGAGTVATDEFGNKTMAEDAYNIAFYDQNEVGTYSSGQSSATELSYARFVVDRTAPTADVSYDTEKGVKEGDVYWFKSEDVAVTLTAVDHWANATEETTPEEEANHVSGVKGFGYAVGAGEEQKVEGDTVVLTGAEISAKGTTDVKVHATDNAGNDSTSQVVTIGVDDAGPTYAKAAINGLNGVLDAGKTNYVNAKDAQYWEKSVQLSGVADYADADGTIAGIGIDRSGEGETLKSYWTFKNDADDSVAAKQAFVSEEGYDDVDTVDFSQLVGDDGFYTLTLHYADKLGNTTGDTTYSIVVDTTAATWTLAEGYTYTVDGGAIGEDKSPATTQAVVDPLVQAAYDFAWSNDYSFTWELADATSGLESYQAYTKNAAGEWVADTDEPTPLSEEFYKITVTGDKTTPDSEGVVEKKYVITDKAGNTSDLLATLKLDTTIDGTVKVVTKDDTAKLTKVGDVYYVTGDYALEYTETADGKSDANYVYTRTDGTGVWTQNALTANAYTLDGAAADHKEMTYSAIITDAAGNQLTLGDVTVVKDTVGPTQAIRTGYRYTTDGGAASTSPYAPTTKGGTYATEGAVTTFADWSKDYSITVDFSDVTSGYDHYEVEWFLSTDGGETYVSTGTKESTDAYTVFGNSGDVADGIWKNVVTTYDKAGNATTHTYIAKSDKTIDATVSVKGGNTLFSTDAEGYEDKGTYYVMATDVGTETASYSLNFAMVDDKKSDASLVYFRVNGTTDWTTYEYNADIALTGAKGTTVTYDAIVTDKAGNQKSMTFSVKVDVETPDQVESLVRGGTTESNNYIEYTQDGQRIDASDWVNTNQGKDVVLDVTFNNESSESSETHFVATKFDIAAYNTALAKYKQAGKSDDEARELALADGAKAAGGAWTEVGTTVSEGGSATARATYSVSDHSTYYFYSKDEVGHVSEYSVNEVKIDNIAPVFERESATAADPANNIAFRVAATDLGGSGINANSYKITNNTGSEVTFKMGGVEQTLADGESVDYVEGATIEIAKGYDALTFSVNDNAGNVKTQTIGELSIKAVELDGTALTASSMTWVGGADNRGVLTVALDGKEGQPAGLEYWDVDRLEWVACEAKTDESGNVVGFYLLTADEAAAGGKKFEELTLRATAGGAEADRTFKAGVDTAAPTVGTSMTTADGSVYDGSWTNQDVAVKVDYTDNLSGVFGRTWEDKVISAESATVEGTKVEFTTQDNAGNTGTGSVTVKIDKTAAVLTRTDTYDGSWTNQDVTITARATDALSGVATATDLTKTYTEEGVLVGTVVFKREDTLDNAGNTAAEDVTATIRIDKTEAVIKTDTNGYAAGTWTNETVVVSATATDALSGFDEAGTLTKDLADQAFDTDGIYTATFKGTDATDMAGNVAGDATVSVKVDKTAATVAATATADGEAYEIGSWTNAESVTVTAVATDNLSGFDAAGTLTKTLVEKTVADEGVSYATFEGSEATDMAGNVGTGASYAVKIDRTAAAITVTANPSEYTQGAVVLTASVADDGLSAQGAVEHSLDGGTTWVAGASVTLVANGTAYFRSADEAGNVSQDLYEVKNIWSGSTLDLTGKTVTLTAGSYSFETLSLSGSTLTVGPNCTFAATTLAATAGANALVGAVDVASVQVAEGATLAVGGAFFDSIQPTAAFALAGQLQVGGEATLGDVAWAYTTAGVDDIAWTGNLAEAVNKLSFYTNKVVLNKTTVKSGTEAEKKIGFGNAYGTAKSDTVTFGKETDVTIGNAGATLDLLGGTNAVKVEKNADAAIRSNVQNLSKLTVAAGTAAKVGGVKVQQYTAFAAASVAMTDKANTVTFGNYGIGSFDALSTLAGNDKVTFGNYDTATFGLLDFGEGNDTLKVGNGSTLTAAKMDFGAGKDTLKVGKGTTLTVTDLDVEGLDKLTIGKDSKLYLGADSFAEAQAKAATDKTWAKYISNGQIAAIA